MLVINSTNINKTNNHLKFGYTWQYVQQQNNKSEWDNKDYYAFCKFLLLYKFIRYFGIYHKELYSVDILCENSISTMPVSRGEGWVFSCLSSYI